MKYFFFLTAVLSILLFSCDSPEKVEVINITPDSVAKSDAQIATDSSAYYKQNIQGKWYRTGMPDETMQIDQTSINHSELVATNYKFTSLHELTESNHEDEANYIVWLRNDSLIMYHKEEARTLYYRRTPH